MATVAHSPSMAVTRALQSLAMLGENHSLTLHYDGTAIHITRTNEIVQTLPCPAHPAQLLRALQTLNTASLPALDHGWQFDATGRKLSHAHESHALTEKEALLLAALLAAWPQACGREQLLKNVWSMQADVETHTLETHIYRLRHKLEALAPRPCDIITTGSAYQLVLASE